MLIHELAAIPDLLALQAANPKLFPGLLESAASPSIRSRFDLLMVSSGERIVLNADGGLSDASAGASGQGDGRFLAALDAAWQRARPERALSRGSLPFAGGWLLYLGYDLVQEIEPTLRRTAQGEHSMPTALAERCPAALIVDRTEQRAFAVAEVGHDALFERLCGLAEAGAELPAGDRFTAEFEEDPAEDFLLGVNRVHEYLAAGDVFQVNLSRRWRAALTGDVAPASLYRQLRQANPAPFSGLLVQPGWSLVCSSPERLVSRRGDRIETRPIAGTRARFAGDNDQARLQELVGHPKERAEHIMLIDLERNDLGRVSATGSVRVDALMEVESYAHVHHIESTVSGLARPGLTPGELIAAVFPGGTITGCPKVRCMQIIDELESTSRGAYTGALGWLDHSGDLDLNILIRSAVLSERHLEFRAGAGIVIDSVAESELEETRAKAQGLLRAFANSA